MLCFGLFLGDFNFLFFSYLFDVSGLLMLSNFDKEDGLDLLKMSYTLKFDLFFLFLVHAFSSIRAI